MVRCGSDHDVVIDVRVVFALDERAVHLPFMFAVLSLALSIGIASIANRSA